MCGWGGGEGIRGVCSGGYMFPSLSGARQTEDSTFPGQESDQETDAQNKPKQKKKRPGSQVTSSLRQQPWRKGADFRRIEGVPFSSPQNLQANFPSRFRERRRSGAEPGGRAEPSGPSAPPALLCPGFTRIANALGEM